MSDLLEPLKAAIIGEFIPAVTGRSVGELESKLLALSVSGRIWPAWLILLQLLVLSLVLLNQSLSVLTNQILQQQKNFDANFCFSF